MASWKLMIRLIAATLLAGTVISGSGPALSQSNSTATPTKIRVGGITSLLYLPFYVAMEEGYFKKNGIEIELILASNPVPALLSGEIELILTASDTGVVSAFRGNTGGYAFTKDPTNVHPS